jgi:GNAT superfamily N-acetyltransferase
MTGIEIVDTNAENILNYGICGYINVKRPGFLEKVEWLKERFSEGMRVKTLYSQKDGTQGMIEYIPGEYCWRPVDAEGYMFIHCIFVGFKRDYKNKGYATLLLNECVEDAKKAHTYGVAATTRKGAFMAGKELFVKNGFSVVDTAPPDFELVVKKFTQDAPDPRFKGDWKARLNQYKSGLTILRADQCPYTVKNVREIVKTAQETFGIEPKIATQKNHLEAQKSPCPFGTFCIIFNGEVVAHHPISKTRFVNIMNTLLK